MLYIHDRQAEGASLRDLAGSVLDAMPDDWRSCPERSDLRRLAETASALIAGGYRPLLGTSRGRSSPTPMPLLLPQCAPPLYRHHPSPLPPYHRRTCRTHYPAPPRSRKYYAIYTRP